MTGSTEIQYSVMYPLGLTREDKDVEWQNYGRVENRAAAERLREFFNKRAVDQGYPPRAYLIQRTVTTTPWVPANSGIVPPPYSGGAE